MSAAELTALADDRHPWDWYIDESWCSEALIGVLGFDAFMGQLIHDPCCGRGTIPQVFDMFGFRVSGADVEDRRGAHGFAVGEWPFEIRDFFLAPIAPHDGRASIVFNPPYSLQNDCIVTGLTALMVAKAHPARHRTRAGDRAAPSRLWPGDGRSGRRDRRNEPRPASGLCPRRRRARYRRRGCPQWLSHAHR